MLRARVCLTKNFKRYAVFTWRHDPQEINSVMYTIFPLTRVFYYLLFAERLTWRRCQVIQGSTVRHLTHVWLKKERKKKKTMIYTWLGARQSSGRMCLRELWVLFMALPNPIFNVTFLPRGKLEWLCCLELCISRSVTDILKIYYLNASNNDKKQNEAYIPLCLPCQ